MSKSSSRKRRTAFFIIVPKNDPKISLDKCVENYVHQSRPSPFFMEPQLIPTDGFVEISASRLNASATPSSSSERVAGREYRRSVAKAARSESVSPIASFFNS